MRKVNQDEKKTVRDRKKVYLRTEVVPQGLIDGDTSLGSSVLVLHTHSHTHMQTNNHAHIGVPIDVLTSFLSSAISDDVLIPYSFASLAKAAGLHCNAFT